VLTDVSVASMTSTKPSSMNSHLRDSRMRKTEEMYAPDVLKHTSLSKINWSTERIEIKKSTKKIRN
jgi:hypothetical protein